MMSVYLAGRGLASALGADLNAALATLQSAGYRYTAAAQRRLLPGGMGGEIPYYAIAFTLPDWYERARHLVQHVGEQVGAAQARDGALFVATSSFDIGAIESGDGQLQHEGNRVFIAMLSRWLHWRGPVYTINTGCTSSLNALLAARAQLLAGEVTDALVLGLELENRLTLGGFASLQLLTRTACRPFGLQRDGLVLGEAVAALRLSTRAQGEWRLLGGAHVVDGSQPTSVSPLGLGEMYRTALADSAVAAVDIDLLKVQAAGSPGNDRIEAQCLLDAFGPDPAVVSLKALIGHTLGASGVAEVALLLACLDAGVGVAPQHSLDPDLHIDGARWPPDARRVLASIQGFGGSHGAVIVERR